MGAHSYVEYVCVRVCVFIIFCMSAHSKHCCMTVHNMFPVQTKQRIDKKAAVTKEDLAKQNKILEMAQKITKGLCISLSLSLSLSLS